MVTQPVKPAPVGDPILEISQFLAPELQQVEQILREVATSDSALIREVGEYVCLAGGKKLRPSIILLTARAFGPAAISPVYVAAAIEAVHVATLIHDDVVDKARVRRGQPSVNARWGDDVAVLMADFLYAAAFELVLKHLDPEPLRLICQVTRRMCEGEMFQIERRGHWLTAEDYMHIISGKTAYLFSACAALGGMSVGLSAGAITQVSAFGMDFGLAFQITDDTLDYRADDEHWGKAVGIDLASGKQTLPLILAFQSATAEDRQVLETILNDGRDFTVISQIIERYGAIGRSLDQARNHARQASAHIKGLPVCSETAYELLRALPEYVINRRY